MTATNIGLKSFLRLISPSSSSAIFCIVASLVLTLTVVALSHYQSSSLRLQYLYYQGHHHASSSHLASSLLSNSLINNLPLLLFWAFVGLVIYLIAADIVRAIQASIDIKHELDYVNVNREVLIRSTLEQLGIRLIAVIVLFPYLIFFVRKVVPYAITLALVSTTSGGAIQIPLYILMSIGVTAIGLHICIVLLRLIFLRSRLFEIN